MMVAIPNGTKVRFFRPAHHINHFEAIVRRSHRLSGGKGFHYEIDCKEFPYVIGFAHDEEIFVDVELANAAVKVARTAYVESKRKELLAKKQQIEAELDALNNLL